MSATGLKFAEDANMVDKTTRLDTTNTIIKDDAKRRGRAKEEAARGNILIRLNEAQTADLTAVAVDDALEAEMRSALASRRYYSDATSVLFVSPQLATELYRVSFELAKRSNAHRVGSRALRKKINLQIDPPIPNLEVESGEQEAGSKELRPQEEMPEPRPSGPDVGLWIGGLAGSRYIVEIDRNGQGTVTTVTIRLSDEPASDASTLVEAFEDSLDAYKSWSEQNQAGYVLNVKPGQAPAMLHRTTCSHVYPAKPEYGDFTKKKKVCSPDRQSLETWAKQADIQFALCSSCDV